MATKKHDVVATVGKYTDKNTGEEKSRFLNCGAHIVSDKGEFLKIDTIPVGWDGWFKLMEPRQRGQSSPPRQTEKPADTGDFDDDLPF